ncbi:MAG: hypothetical protein ABSC06_26295 [Rhodopila sp.]|jgi:hypothetical protein
MDWFDALALSSSAPYRNSAIASQMRAVFLTGVVPDSIAPHVERALVELPVELLARAADELPDASWPAIRDNLQILAKTIGAEERLHQWLFG